MLIDRSQPEDKMLQDRSVLVIDNDKQIVYLIKDILENQGFNVVTAFCGEAAIEKLREGKYACAILDYSLPDIKGDELADNFRLEEPNIGIILLTGFKSSIDPDKLKVFNYVFEKPVKLEVLIAAVKQITSLRIREHERASALQSNHYSHFRSARARLG